MKRTKLLWVKMRGRVRARHLALLALQIAVPVEAVTTLDPAKPTLSIRLRRHANGDSQIRSG